MLSIKDSLPDILKGSNAYKFACLIDALNEYKQIQIANALRVYNPILCVDSKWLIKQLTDYGFYVPTGYPWQPLQQLLLNVQTITRMKGTTLGLKTIVSVLTLGEVSDINISEFYKTFNYVSPNDLNYGFITGDDTTNTQLYLVDNSDDFNPQTSLTFSIKTPYVSNKIVKDYVTNIIKEWLPVADNNILNITWSSRGDFYFNELLNDKFVNR